jgi:hypothetical protein
MIRAIAAHYCSLFLFLFWTAHQHYWSNRTTPKLITDAKMLINNGNQSICHSLPADTGKALFKKDQYWSLCIWKKPWLHVPTFTVIRRETTVDVAAGSLSPKKSTRSESGNEQREAYINADASSVSRDFLGSIE